MKTEYIYWLQVTAKSVKLAAVPCNWHPNIETGDSTECGQPAEFLAVMRAPGVHSAFVGWDALPLCATHYDEARALHRQAQEAQAEQQQPVLRAVVSLACDRDDHARCKPALSGCTCSCHHASPQAETGGDA